MPSYGSRSPAVARGRVTSTAVTAVAEPHDSTPAAVAVTWVWPWNSDAGPVTCTTAPLLTRLAPLSNTKMPSDVAGSPSPLSWR